MNWYEAFSLAVCIWLCLVGYILLVAAMFVMRRT